MQTRRTAIWYHKLVPWGPMGSYSDWELLGRTPRESELRPEGEEQSKVWSHVEIM